MATVIEDLSDPIGSLKNCSREGNTRNTVLRCKIPILCKSKPCIVGVDEAGRGPVLGPMVYGICYCVKSNEQLLKDNNCADSKSLTEQKREEIFNLLCNEKESIGWAVDIISPSWISNCMLRRQKYSLNEISHNSAIQLITCLQESGVNVEEVYIDTVGPPEKYQAKLMNIFPSLKITVSKKADSLFPIVSAASICAKVTRDVVLKTWIFPKGTKVSDENGWGSGYPGDAVTKNFLQENIDPIFGFPNIVRFSWSTAENVLKENAVPVEWSDDEDNLPTGHRSISSYFSNKQKRHIFFSERNLETAEYF